MAKSKLFRRAAEEEIPESSLSTSEVMAWVERNRTEVLHSEKEVPERFQDLRPTEGEGEVDPGNFYVPGQLCGSRTQMDAVNIGNFHVFMKRYADLEGVFPLSGDHGSFGVALRISAITSDMLEDLKVLAESPNKDNIEKAKSDHEMIDTAWDEWAHYDFIRALEQEYPQNGDWIDSLDEDRARQLFDRVRHRLGVDWTPEEDSVFIDVAEIASGVELSDIEEREVEDPSL